MLTANHQKKSIALIGFVFQIQVQKCFSLTSKNGCLKITNPLKIGFKRV
jgi:hypothetical protein